MDRFRERVVIFAHAPDARFPYVADVDGARWRVRVNEFPEEPSVYTLFVDERAVLDLMEWPATWSRPG